MPQKEKSKTLNPYTIKVAVSTGPRGPGRRKFVAGSVEQLRRRWRNQGVNVVRRERADYVVVPDGVDYPGKLKAQSITYSEFVNLLQSHTAPIRSRKKTQAISSNEVSLSPRRKPTPTKTSLDFKPHHRFIKQLLNQQRQTTKKTKKSRQQSRSQSRPRSLSTSPLPASLEVRQTLHDMKQVLGQLVSADDSNPLWYATEQNYLKMEDDMKQLTEVSWQKAVERAVDANAPFHVELYKETEQLLQRMALKLYYVLRYWASLRINLQTPLNLPPRVELSETDPCKLSQPVLRAVHSYLPEHGPILSAWQHYRDHWNAQTQRILAEKDLWQNVPDDEYTSLSQYFWQIETDLYLMYGSLRCALSTWQDKIQQWAHQVRSRTQQPLPFLFVMSDLVKAYCGSSEMSVSTTAEKRGLLKLWDDLRVRHESWFGTGADFSSDQKNRGIFEACSEVRRLHHDLITTLKRDLGLNSDQDVVWSQLARLADLKGISWEKLWSRDSQVRAPVLDYLKQLIYSPQYQRAARQTLLNH